MLISKAISWISCSGFPPSQIAEEFVGWMNCGQKTLELPHLDIEDLREEYELLGWRVILLEAKDPNTPLTDLSNR